MYFSSGLEYIVGSSYSTNPYFKINYFSKNIDDNYEFKSTEPIIFETPYKGKTLTTQYKNQQKYITTYIANHSFTPEIFLNPSRPKTKFVGDNNEIKGIVEETFELMMKDKLPSNISFNVLPFNEFKLIHSAFGEWSNGILGFSINGSKKQIFVRENHLDSLILVIGHEIGHVITETLTNKHDEEAKAFAFSIEWANIIKEHNVANLGLSIKEDFKFEPARNGLHDIAFNFVNLMLKTGRNAFELHKDLARKYVSIFSINYV